MSLKFVVLHRVEGGSNVQICLQNRSSHCGRVEYAGYLHVFFFPTQQNMKLCGSELNICVKVDNYLLFTKQQNFGHFLTGNKRRQQKKKKNPTQNLKTFFWKGRKHCRKRRKSWLQAFFFSFSLNVFKSCAWGS